MGARYGVKILWPVLLLQHRMLRLSLAFLSHSATTQAITYALEGIIEEALREDCGAQAESVIALWRRLDPAQPEVFEMLRSRGAIFSSWTKAQRKTNFLELLASFDPMYQSDYNLRLLRSEKGLLSPGQFALWDHVEWPDPGW